jgi:hypothetical protein
MQHIRTQRQKEHELQISEAEQHPCTKIDPNFLQLVNESRPVGHYFEQTIGDKLLLIKRIDGL